MTRLEITLPFTAFYHKDLETLELIRHTLRKGGPGVWACSCGSDDCTGYYVWKRTWKLVESGEKAKKLLDEATYTSWSVE